MPVPTITMLSAARTVNFSVANSTPTPNTTMGMEAWGRGAAAAAARAGAMERGGCVDHPWVAESTGGCVEEGTQTVASCHAYRAESSATCAANPV